MMKRTGILLLAGLLLLTGCSAEGQSTEPPDTAPGYRQIDQETAKQMMEQDDGAVIVDVRRFDEYESGHIPGAICIPNESIGETRPEELPDPDQTLLIYCRSGNRSKQAAAKLAAMGYARICEFGGIIDWTGEVVTGQTLALTVASNPTTGFGWEAAQDADLFEIRGSYIAEPQSEPVSGAGGWQRFLLIPKQAGTAQVTFTYTRPWERSDGDLCFSCRFEISEDLAITLIGDGSAEAAAQGFAPAVKIY